MSSCWLVVLAIVCGLADGASSVIHLNTSAEHRLYRHLIKASDYLKTMRPVRNHSRAISVKLGMCVMMLEDVIERDGSMVMSVCIKMRWEDEFLRWDPRKFDGLQWMAVPVTDIWQPDIALVNSAEPYMLTRKPAQADVTADGHVGYYPAGRMATKCSLDITYFPMDYQRCEVRYESWVYPLQALDIEEWDGEASVDIKDLYTNHLWTIATYYVVRDTITYDDVQFARLKFVFELKRKPLYFFMYIIFPLLLLSALQTLGHTLPVEHPGRMAMLTALFIGSSVTQQSIAVHVPKTSETVSLIQIYSTIVNVTLFISMVISFVMLYTLLRLPPEEPGFWTLLCNFFSISWSTRNCKKIDGPISFSMAMTGIRGSTVFCPELSDAQLNTTGGGNEGFDRSLMRRLLPLSAKTSVGNEGLPQQQTPVMNPSGPNRPTNFSSLRKNSGAGGLPSWLRHVNSGDSMMSRHRSNTASAAVQLSSPLADRASRGSSPVSGGGGGFVAIDMPSDQPGDAQSAPTSQRKSVYKTDAERRKADAENAERHKKRWLIYCVALDKSIMYVILAFQLVVPVILFFSIPRIQTFGPLPPGIERKPLDI